MASSCIKKGNIFKGYINIGDMDRETSCLLCSVSSSLDSPPFGAGG
nr:MAG TPA: hypothetical protein [Caudoviricetes sp.]